MRSNQQYVIDGISSRYSANNSNTSSDLSNTSSTVSRRRSTPNKQDLLATKLKEINRRRHSLVQSDDAALNTNIANMKKYVAELKASSVFKTTTATSNAIAGKQHQHRGYNDIKKDLLKLRKRHSITHNEPFQQNGDDSHQLLVIENSHHEPSHGSFMHLNGHHNQSETTMIMIPNNDGTYALNGDSHRYAKDYVTMAHEYKRKHIYRFDNSDVKQNICVECKSMALKRKVPLLVKNEKTLSKIFFPCEHLCICDDCFMKSGPWNICPLCNQSIKVVFDHNGKEVINYWNWVHEIKPKLSSSFRKSFPRSSRRVIADAMAKSIEDLDDQHDGSESYLSNDLESIAEVKSKACVIS